MKLYLVTLKRNNLPAMHCLITKNEDAAYAEARQRVRQLAEEGYEYRKEESTNRRAMLKRSEETWAVVEISEGMS